MTTKGGTRVGLLPLLAWSVTLLSLFGTACQNGVDETGSSGEEGAKRVAEEIVRAVFRSDVESAVKFFHPLDQTQARSNLVSEVDEVESSGLKLDRIEGSAFRAAQTALGSDNVEVVYIVVGGSRCGASIVFTVIDGKHYPAPGYVESIYGACED